ncbi:hypothetical protein DMENIID0001_156860 [Sergentomyia squamirostris]
MWKAIDEQLEKSPGSSEARYKTLREQYRKALAKETAQTRSGAGQNDGEPWKYMQQMAFLKSSFMKRAASVDFLAAPKRKKLCPIGLPGAERQSASSLSGLQASSTSIRAHNILSQLPSTSSSSYSQNPAFAPVTSTVTSAHNILSQLPSTCSPSIQSSSHLQNPGFEPTVGSENPHFPTTAQNDPLNTYHNFSGFTQSKSKQ